MTKDIDGQFEPLLYGRLRLLALVVHSATLFPIDKAAASNCLSYLE